VVLVAGVVGSFVAIVSTTIALGGLLSATGFPIRGGRGDALGTVLIVVCWVVSLLVALSGAYYLRDWLLLRRIRFVLRTRGRCAACGYNLVGLPAEVREGAEPRVTCPECGFVTEVDVALSVLTVDEAGRQRLGESRQVPVGPARRGGRRWVPGKKLWKRAGLFAGLAVLLVGSWVGWDEYSIRQQAKRAAAMVVVALPGVRAVPNRPPPRPGAMPASAQLQGALKVLRAAHGGLNFPAEALNLPQVVAVSPQHAAYEPVKRRGARREWLSSVVSRQVARAVLDGAEAGGIGPLIDALAEAPIDEFGWGSGVPVLPPLNPTDVFRLALHFVGAAELAVDRDDPAGFAKAAARAQLVVDAARAQRWFFASTFVADAEGRLFAAARRGVSQWGGAVWVEAASSVRLGEDRGGLGPELEADFVRQFDRQAAFTFVKPGDARLWGWFGEHRAALAPWGEQRATGLRLGTLEESLAAVRELAKPFGSVQAASEKVAGTLSATRRPGLLAVAWLDRFVDRALLDLLRNENERRALVAMLAVERYRERHGVLPTALADAPESGVPPLPVDVLSGVDFGYALRGNDPDFAPRGYALWSVGADGVDNGGAMTDTEEWSGWTAHRGPDVCYTVGWKSAGSAYAELRAGVWLMDHGRVSAEDLAKAPLVEAVSALAALPPGDPRRANAVARVERVWSEPSEHAAVLFAAGTPLSPPGVVPPGTLEMMGVVDGLLARVEAALARGDRAAAIKVLSTAWAGTVAVASQPSVAERRAAVAALNRFVDVAENVGRALHEHGTAAEVATLVGEWTTGKDWPRLEAVCDGERMVRLAQVERDYAELGGPGRPSAAAVEAWHAARGLPVPALGAGERWPTRAEAIDEVDALWNRARAWDEMIEAQRLLFPHYGHAASWASVGARFFMVRHQSDPGLDGLIGADRRARLRLAACLATSLLRRGEIDAAVPVGSFTPFGEDVLARFGDPYAAPFRSPKLMYKFNAQAGAGEPRHLFISVGPNGVYEQGGGDDIVIVPGEALPER
jgi:hypothetical protein